MCVGGGGEGEKEIFIEVEILPLTVHTSHVQCIHGHSLEDNSTAGG